MAKKKPVKKNINSKSSGNDKSIKPKNKRKSAAQSKSKKKTIGKKTHLNKNRGLGLYIRVKSLLWKEFKSDYKGLDYRQRDSNFLNLVHKVFSECKHSGADCPNEVLITKYQQIVGHLKRPEPFIDPELYLSTDDNEYWNIFNVEFDIFEPYLWVKSPMILSPPSEFNISDYLRLVKSDKEGSNYRVDKNFGYEKQFKQWVDWCNVHFYGVDSDGDIAYFLFSKPNWNKKLNRWETEIFITDKIGTPNSYGYIPDGGKAVEDLPSTLISDRPKEEEKQKKTKKTKISEQGQKNIDLLNLLIIKKESLQQDILFWKAIGNAEEMDRAVKRLKITILRIDKIGE